MKLIYHFCWSSTIYLVAVTASSLHKGLEMYCRTVDNILYNDTI